MTLVVKKILSLFEQMPAVEGRLRADADLSKVTWFQVGGSADVLFKPKDEDDLSNFLIKLSTDIPVFTLGVGSNLLVRDDGFRGVVLRLGREFTKMEIVNDTCIRIGAGALDINVAKFAGEAGLTGAEFLSGIPGAIGGALRMNAGAYGTEMKDIVLSVVAYDRQGKRHELCPADMGFSYRHCDIPLDWIFTEAMIQLQKGNKSDIGERMKEISKNREDSQPIKSRTGGSTFANPEGKKAWELIDAVGARGLTIGNAQISDKHCNFLINKGGATAADIEAVGEEARRRVFKEFDTLLRWEIVRIGDPLLPKEKQDQGAKK
ncbi:MAG: UDP-N-acetylmuramate dehydrogenase [Sneathiella sp.]|nr:UDP-N-acetylmuramate dehydrogenase [Sneathiella sp.]